MKQKLLAAAKTLFKYLFWTAIGAVLTELANLVPTWNIPEMYIPLIGAALKSAATFVATKKAGV